MGYVLDDTAVAALGRGERGPTVLLASLDSRSVRVSIPVVTLAAAFAELSVDKCAELVGMIDSLPYLKLAGLRRAGPIGSAGADA